MKKLLSFLTTTIVATLAIVPLHQARGQISYSIAGSTYSQNFDSLPNKPENVTLGTSSIGWTDDNASPGANQFSIVGWYLYHPTLQGEGGANGHQRVRIGAGTANTGAFMSFGINSNSTERALGDVGSNTITGQNAPTNDVWLGFRLRNNTGATLNNFTLSYNGEQWRDGGSATPNAQTMNFMWSTTATAISDPNSSFTPVPALDFTSPVFVSASGAAVDGNVAGKVAGITATVSGINWADGTDLWLRWDDINHAGNDHGLAIDNLNFSAVPEPAGLSLLALGALALLGYRLRR